MQDLRYKFTREDRIRSFRIKGRFYKAVSTRYILPDKTVYRSIRLYTGISPNPIKNWEWIEEK